VGGRGGGVGGSGGEGDDGGCDDRTSFLFWVIILLKRLRHRMPHAPSHASKSQTPTSSNHTIVHPAARYARRRAKGVRIGHGCGVLFIKSLTAQQRPINSCHNTASHPPPATYPSNPSSSNSFVSFKQHSTSGWIGRWWGMGCGIVTGIYGPLLGCKGFDELTWTRTKKTILTSVRQVPHCCVRYSPTSADSDSPIGVP
jgi:hypothetical protein